MDDFIQRFNELEAERQIYLLDNLASHLMLGGRSQQLYRLIDKPWLDLKLARTLSHVSFDNDLSLAIQVASEDDSHTSLLQLVRTAWLHSTLHSSVLNAPPKLIELLGRVGQVTRAVGLAQFLELAARERVFYAIGIGLLQQGKFGKAEDILRRYMDLRSDPTAGHSIEDIKSARNDIQVQKAKALVRIGKAGDGQSMIAFMAEGPEKWQLLCEFALNSIQKGHKDYVVETADRVWNVVHRPSNQANVTNDIILSLIKIFSQTNKQQAISIAQAVQAWPETPSLEKLRLSGEIGLILARLGEVAAASEAIQPILNVIEETSETSSSYQGPLLPAIQVLTLLGEVDLAQATAAKLQNDRWQTRALCAIVDGLVESDEPAAAAEIAASAFKSTEQFDEYEPQLTADTFLKLTQALAKTGAREDMFQAARRAMYYADDGYGYEARFLGDIVEVMAILAPEDSLRWAVDKAKSIWSADRTSGFTAFVAVAQASIRLGYLAYLQEILDAFSRTNDPWGEKLRRLTEIAETLVAEGYQDRAAELINELLAEAAVTEPTSRVLMLRGNLQAFAELRAVDRAEIIADSMRKTADTFEYDIDWALALADMATDLFQAGAVETSEKIIQILLNNLWNLGDRWHVVSNRHIVGVLYLIGRLQVRMGNLEKASDLVRSIEDPYLKVTYLLEVAAELINNQQLDDGLDLLEQADLQADYIHNDFYQAEAISLIAQKLAEIGYFDEALNMALTIAEAVPKALALQRIAYYLVRDRQTIRAGQAAETALAVADEIDFGHETAVLSGVARVFAVIDDPARLRPVVNNVLKNTRTMQRQWEDKSFIHRPLIWLSQAAMIRGDDKLLKRILAQVRTLAGPYQVEAVGGIAQALVEHEYAKALEPLLALVDAIESNETRSESLEKITGALVAGQWHSQALALWKMNLLASYDLGRTRLAFVLQSGFPLLARLVEGDDLWALSQALIAIESWWDN